MALPYIVAKYVASTEGVSAASLTWESWPAAADQAADDWFVILCHNDVGTTALGIDAGWTEYLGPAANAVGRTGVFAIRRSTTEITAPTLTGTSAPWRATMLHIRGAGATLLDAASAKTLYSSNTTLPEFPDITTTNADCLILRVLGMDVGCQAIPTALFAPMVLVDRGSDISDNLGALELNISYQNQRTAGATGAIEMTRSGAARGATFTLAIIGDANGAAMPEMDTTGHAVAHYHGGSTIGTYTWSDISTIRASLYGASTAACTSLNLLTERGPYLTQGNYGGITRVGLSPPADANVFIGAYTDLIATADLSTTLTSLVYRAVGTSLGDVRGSALYFEDTTGNWALWVPVPRAQSAPLHNLVAFLPDEVMIDQSVDPIDWSSIARFGCGYLKTAAAGNADYFLVARLCSITGPITFAGGNASNPLTPAWIAQAIADTSYFVGATPLAGSLAAIARPFRIGNSVVTYFQARGQAISVPTVGDTGFRGYRARPRDIEITVDLDAGDTMRTAASVIAAAGQQKLTFAATTDATADYVLGGAISNMDLTLATNAPVDGAVLTTCGKIKATGCAVSACRVIDTTSTDAAISFTENTGSIVDTTINLTGVTCDYHVELGTDVTTFNATDAVFSGTAQVANIHVLRTTGTVTITLAQGQDQPTTDSEGATIAFDQPVLGTSWTNEDLVDGTTVLVRNVTTSTTIAYVASLATGTGYTIAMVPGTDYTVGNVIEIRQSRKNVKAYYEERTTRIITTAAGGDLVEAGALADCPVCNEIDLDGDDYASKFELDYIDDELDIEVAGPWQTGELIVWWKGEMTKQTPMEQFWGAWTVLTNGSFYNHVATLSSLIDTTETGDSIESTGRRIYRSDDARPIKSPTTGGGTVDFSWRDPVTKVTTGSGVTPSDVTAIGAEVWSNTTGAAVDTRTARVDGLIEDDSGDQFTAKAMSQAAAGSGLTAQEVRDAMKLAPTAGAAAADSIDEKLDTVPADVRTELTTELGRIDSAISTRLATASYVAPDNAGIAAIPTNPVLATDARLDNLDATVSSRLATASYTAPANSDIASIKAKTDNLPAAPAAVGDIPTAASNAAAVRSELTPELGLVDSAISTRLAAADYTAPANADIATIATRTARVDALIENVTGDRFTAKALEQAAGSGGATPEQIWTHATRTLTAGVPTASDNATAVRAELATELGRVDAAVSTRLAAADYTAPDNSGIAAIPTNPLLTTDVRLDHLDAAISTRLPTSGYTAPANADIAAVKAKTDNLPAAPAAVGDIPTSSANASAVRVELATELGRVDTAISTRLPTADYVAPANADVALIKAKTDNLTFTGTDVKATLDGEQVTTDTASREASKADVTGLATSVAVAAIPTNPVLTDDVRLSNLDATVSSRLPTTSYTAPANADISAIKAKTDNLPTAPAASSDVPSAVDNATAVRAELATELGRVDVAVSTRLADASYTAPDNAGIAAIPTNPLLVTDARLDRLDADVSSRLASAGYTPPDNAGISGIKANTDIIPALL